MAGFVAGREVIRVDAAGLQVDEPLPVRRQAHRPGEPAFDERALAVREIHAVEVGPRGAPFDLSRVRRLDPADGPRQVVGGRDRLHLLVGDLAQRARRDVEQGGLRRPAQLRDLDDLHRLRVVVFPVVDVDVGLRVGGRRLLGFLFLEADEQPGAVLAPARRRELADHHVLRERRRLGRVERGRLHLRRAGVPPGEHDVLAQGLPLRLVAAQHRQVRAFRAPRELVVVGRGGVERLLFAAGERHQVDAVAQALIAANGVGHQLAGVVEPVAAHLADVALGAGGEMAHQQVRARSCRGLGGPARRRGRLAPAAASAAGAAWAPCGRISSHSPSGENAKLPTDGNVVFVPFERSSSSNVRVGAASEPAAAPAAGAGALPPRARAAPAPAGRRRRLDEVADPSPVVREGGARAPQHVVDLVAVERLDEQRGVALVRRDRVEHPLAVGRDGRRR